MTVLESPIAPLSFAPQVLSAAVFAGGALVGIGATFAARWGARQARTAKAIAEAAGHLVVIQSVDGGACTPLCVPPRLAALVATGDFSGTGAPPWHPDVASGIESLRERVVASPSQSATMEWELSDRRLRLVGARIGDGAQLLVSLAEAGPDVARYNRLESAALLASGVAHDLLNVLSTLAMHADLGHDRAVAPAARTHFARIHIGSTRAAQLVRVMRRYLHGEVPTVDERVPVHVAEIVEEVVELLRPTVSRTLELTLALDATSTVLAEPVHVHQVVLNLIANAVQALEGRLAQRIAVTVASTDGGRTVELVVTDNGPGLPPALRERAFEPFYTTKGKRGGTGLGLAVVRTLVSDALGGSVVADEATGGGARFVVRLPAIVEPAPTADRLEESTNLVAG